MFDYNSCNYLGIYKILLLLVILLLYILGINTLIRYNNQLIKKNIALNTLNNVFKDSIASKDLQLKEIHHRIKNNLQLIVSLLNIEANNNSTSLEAFLLKGQSRIHSIAAIHTNLYENEFSNKINLQNYLESIVQNLSQIYQNDVTIEINAKDTVLDPETAIPIGLIITELVSNAFKHAFIKNNSGCIKIDIIKTKHNKYNMTIQDNGIGFPEKPIAKISIGLDLVSMMVLQINGELQRKNQQGAFYNISF